MKKVTTTTREYDSNGNVVKETVTEKTVPDCNPWAVPYQEPWINQPWKYIYP